ncbi:MoxR family ATPase [Streptomyces sp. DSM 44917]|uniref:MoxR family ATPase n=1 Tax=Streptomyces boetiae TaxID=3075541 RepID=A0ABU2LG84_9ACTN|nr:MoxR family ATPase [Streptomyces sp. DSM 44917]MDT0310526.1 MoxR family ATPase [Streptomyces sp. DSM 44917]
MSGEPGAPSGNGTARPLVPSPAWWVFRDSGRRLSPADPLPTLPPPPPWRRFTPAKDGCAPGQPDGVGLASGTGGDADSIPDPLPDPIPDYGDETRRKLGTARGGTLGPAVLDAVNAAIHLRRPLLVAGRPGTGKSSLAHQIASELGLGRVLWWPVVSRTALRDGLYDFDAIGRVQDAPPPGAGEPDAAEGAADIGRYLTLGPLGTALLPWARPRVLLIDELDKSDIDLPNDLLHTFEEGEFRIRELERYAQTRRTVRVATADPGASATVRDGLIRCHEFPIVVITSNGEREFPPAFRRRCLEVEMDDPDEQRLAAMVASHFGTADGAAATLIRDFLALRGKSGPLAVDQLLSAVHLVTNGAAATDETSWQRLRDALWRSMTSDSSP